MRYLAACLALVLLAPSAAAAPVTGELDRASQAHLEGTVRASSTYAALDLSSAVREGVPIALRAGEVHGLRHAERDLGVSNLYSKEEENETSAVDAADATLTGFACQEDCVVLLVASGDGTLGLEGEAAGALGSLAQDAQYCSHVCSHEAPWFQEDVPAGALVASSAGTFARPPTLVATGNLTLFVKGASFDLATRNGSARIDVTSTQERANPLLPGAVYRGEDRHALLDLKGVRDASASGPFSLDATTMALDVAGSVSSPRASGRLGYLGNQTRFHDEPILVAGTLRLVATPLSGSPPAASGLTGSPWRGDLDGDATRVRVGAWEARASVPSGVATGVVEAGLAGLVLAALAWLGVRAALLPFYSRISPAKVLANPNRARILLLLRAEPGLCPTDLARRLGLARVVVRHHLAILEAHRLVVQRKVEQRRIYLLPGATIGEEVVEAKPMLAQDARRAVARALGRTPAGLTQKEIVEATGLSQRLVSYHLGQLAQARLVVSRGGLPRRYHATELLASALR